MSSAAPFPNRFTPLPVGAVRPAGWLARQLRIQAGGLSGHLDEIWPSIASSQWIGGTDDGWERAPYWLDGFVPLALLLDDPALIGKARRWVDYILAHQHQDGWFGPDANLDPWPQYLVLKALSQWFEGTSDERALPAMLANARRLGGLMDAQPLESWAKMRWVDFAVSLLWLYDRTREAWLLDVARRAQAQGYDWDAHFADFRFTGRQSQWLMENHVVNHAMGLKQPAIRWRLSGDLAEHSRALHAFEVLDRYHGQATGLFSGDESLAGRHPSQGTELCAVVEAMYSLELLTAAFGDAAFADRLERIAYNALPATFTADMWAHQYDQQANQVVCRLAPDGERIYSNNGADANLFGLEPHFGCCTANMHQGWPKLVAHLWMAAPGGLAAAAYGPSVVKSTLDGTAVQIVEETDYPFRDTIRFTVAAERPVRFTLWLRVPAWAGAAKLDGPDGVAALEGTGYHPVEREWRPGESVVVTIPTDVQLQQRDRGAVSVQRGPLVFVLPVGSEQRYVKGKEPYHDRELHPTTPWSYALDLSAGLSVRETPVGPAPFADGSAPVELQTRGRRVPGWGIEKNAAAAPPPSPVHTDEPLSDLRLVPYGCARLRVTEMPVTEDG